MAEILTNIYTSLYQFLTVTLPNGVFEMWNSWIHELFTLNPVSLGIYIQIIFVILLIFVFKLLRNSRFGNTIQLLVERVYELFEEILEISGKHWIKNYVTTLFFVVLLANISGRLVDFVRVIFVDVERLSSVVTVPTTSLEFNAALAIVSIFLMLKAQIDNFGIKGTFHSYIPLTGNNMIKVEKKSLPNIIYYPLFVVIKIFDIAISLFIGMLDIIGLGAKVISLSARLYGNMLAGGVLLTMLVSGIGAMTESLLGAGNAFPVIAPIILYLQSLLVVFIQAFVFPLLVAIFMKLVQNDDQEAELILEEPYIETKLS